MVRDRGAGSIRGLGPGGRGIRTRFGPVSYPVDVPVLDRLGIADADDLLLCYQDRAFRKSLSFLGARRLSAILRQFTVGMPKKLAERVAHPTAEHDWLWVLDDPARYSEATGLADCVSPTDDDVSCLLI